MKVCNECKIKQELDQFFKSKKIKCGYRGVCKTCTTNKDRVRRSTDVFRANQRVYDNDPTNKARIKARKETPEVKAKNKIYRDSGEFKEWEKVRNAKPENKAKRNALRNKRKAAKLNAILPGFDEEIKDIYISNPEGNEVHHIIPLQEHNDKVSGLHVPWNLISLTKEEHLEAHEELRKTFGIRNI